MVFNTIRQMNKGDSFVTFNKKDFVKHENNKLPCYTPSEFLKALESCCFLLFNRLSVVYKSSFTIPVLIKINNESKRNYQNN